jgi:hypothetical protein
MLAGYGRFQNVYMDMKDGSVWRGHLNSSRQIAEEQRRRVQRTGSCRRIALIVHFRKKGQEPCS